jgi:hypothetical protein
MFFLSPRVLKNEARSDLTRRPPGQALHTVQRARSSIKRPGSLYEQRPVRPVFVWDSGELSELPH